MIRLFLILRLFASCNCHLLCSIARFGKRLHNSNSLFPKLVVIVFCFVCFHSTPGIFEVFFSCPRPTGTLPVENAPRVEIVILVMRPKNNEETSSCGSLLQLFVAASFVQHHAFLSLRAPTSRGVAIPFGSPPRSLRRFAPRNDGEASAP
jgi:hypothetical protein